MKFTFSAGDKPFEGYTIKRAIHRGGFGEVYYAQTDAGKEVALKLLHDNMEVELRGVAQCLNLKHPNLVTIFDVKTDADGDHWIVMEYIAGGTLADIIAEHPEGLSHSQTVDIFQQCSEGLAFLHDRGLVHRDLKPANVFTEEGVLKIGDVGLTKFISQTHRSAHTQSVGTVYYMAPEVAKGKYGKGVDIYAMGVIAYEMLTGRVPFDGESTGEILMKHLTEKPDLSPFDKPLADVLERSLEKDEQNRFDSIQEFQQAFNAALSAKPVIVESVESAIADEVDNDDGVHVATGSSQKSKPTGAKQPVEQKKAARKQTSCFDRCAPVCPPMSPPLITQERFEAWWWVPALIGITLLLTRSLFASLMFGGLIAGSVYCFRRSVHFVKQRITPPPQAVQAKAKVKEFISSFRVAKPVRTSRLLTIDMLRGIALAPIIVTLLAGSILFISQDFFSSVSMPHQLDPIQFAFFVASSTFLVWMVIVMNRLFYTKKKKRRNSRLRNGLIGMLCGAAVFGMSDWLMVEYPPQLFPSGTSGIISQIGRHSLVENKQSPLLEAFNTSSDVGELQAHAIESETTAGLNAHAATPVNESFDAHDDFDPFDENEDNAKATTNSFWAPTLPGYAIFFGSLFAWRAWWPLGDVYRKSRFRLGSVGFTILGAYIICCIFTFPAVWAITWAATIAAAIQLASPCEQID